MVMVTAVQRNINNRIAAVVVDEVAVVAASVDNIAVVVAAVSEAVAVVDIVLAAMMVMAKILVHRANKFQNNIIKCSKQGVALMIFR